MLIPSRAHLRAALAVTGVVAVVIGGQAGAAVPSARRGATTRTVALGETLSGLASSMGVSVAQLARANGITDINRIRAGHRLVVPGRSAGAAPAAPAAPANGRGVAERSASRLPERLRQHPARLALLPQFDVAARDYGVPADLLKAMTWLESGWQNDKVSSTKALGIGQLMPDTVAFVNDVLLRARLDPRRPDHNIKMSARFLAYLLRQNGGDVAKSLGSYYQGLASMRRQGPLPETRRYVANVQALRQKF